MPGIKKKWIKASHETEEKSVVDEEAAEEGKEMLQEKDPPKAQSASLKSKPERKTQEQFSKGGMLKGLDGEVLMEKRKRFVPQSESKLSEWLDSNLETRTEDRVPVKDLYIYYTELCQADGGDVLDIPDLNKMIKEKFGKSFGLKEGSILKGVVKERKIIKQKKARPTGIRMKDIVSDALHHFGNPSQGVRFFSLKQYVTIKYPAFQFDRKPKMLKRALEMGVNYGQINLIKGIGMAGFYRLNNGDDQKRKTETDAKKGDNEEESKDDDKHDDKADKDKKSDEDKSQEGSADDKENEDVAEEKTKPTKAKKFLSVDYLKLKHKNPRMIEDSFPLAITYQSAPKVVGISKIRKYIGERYRESMTDIKWRHSIEKGVENGLWEHTSGHGISGSIHLLMDDFDPISSQIEDRICAAIIACHEPKCTSANQIKKYVSQYHPDFRVDERAQNFKKALSRAVAKNMIVQVSGLGASGSFQLTAPFTPSPNVLAGEDFSEDELADEADDNITYVPRGTKSRGISKVKTMEYFSPADTKKRVGHNQNKNPSSRSPRNTLFENEDEDSSSEAKKKVTKGGGAQKKGGKTQKKGGKTQKKGGGRVKARPKRDPSPLTEEEKNEEGEEEVEEEVEVEEEEVVKVDIPEYTPRKSMSRGGSQTQTPAENRRKSQSSTKRGGQSAEAQKKKPPQKSEKAPDSSSPSVSPKKRRHLDDDDADDEEDQKDVPEYTPRKSKSRGGKAKKKK